jgi:hypothetical protein
VIPHSKAILGEVTKAQTMTCKIFGRGRRIETLC